MESFQERKGIQWLSICCLRQPFLRIVWSAVWRERESERAPNCSFNICSCFFPFLRVNGRAKGACCSRQSQAEVVVDCPAANGGAFFTRDSSRQKNRGNYGVMLQMFIYSEGDSAVSVWGSCAGNKHRVAASVIWNYSELEPSCHGANAG